MLKRITILVLTLVTFAMVGAGCVGSQRQDNNLDGLLTIGDQLDGGGSAAPTH